MKTYAIVVKENGKEDYYPDPLYTDKQKGLNKIAYLKEYRIKNNMDICDYELRPLNKIEQIEHTKQWKKWCSAID